MLKITEETTLSEILKNPEAKKILTKYNLPCLSCPYAKSEMETLKIGEICKMYSAKTQNLLKELSQLYPVRSPGQKKFFPKFFLR